MKNMLSVFRKADAVKADDVQGRLAKALAPPPVVAAPRVSVPVVSPEPAPARLVFAFDATASREAAWANSTALTIELLSALPGRLQVALAVHGGNELHTFTGFETDAAKLRACVAAVRCRAGMTCLLDVLARALECEGVGTVLYVGDVFEESERKALKLAASLALRGIRIIILHDNLNGERVPVFHKIAASTGGCVLPFDASALPKLRELLSAIATLAVGGTELLAAKQDAMPAARLLLQHLKG